MNLLAGKKGLIFGIANDRSIAWGIAQNLHAQGAEIGYTHLPDKDPANAKNERRVRKLVDPIGAKVVVPCDVQNTDDIDKAFTAATAAMGPLDFVVHSVAFASLDDLKGPVHACSRDGFKLAMDISVYSLLAITHRARAAMPNGGSILTLTYLGGERVIPGYNIMGLCKSALESGVEYLAFELGVDKIRVNALSAGPIKSLAASAVSDIDKMFEIYEVMAPMRRNVDQNECGKTAVYLLSDLSSGVTGETLHVDAGFHIMGCPPPSAGQA